MPRTFREEATDKLRAMIHAYTLDPEGIPGLVYVVVGRDGQQYFAHASGQRGLGRPEAMSLDTIFWMASCTKLVTTIAAMQLVEQGRVRLDSEEDIECVLPELSLLMVLTEDTNGTLKMVQQQPGFGYSFSNAKLQRWYDPIGVNEFDNQEWDLFQQPLVNQPGSAWEYGISIDWAGRLVERLSGLSLNDYCRLAIFEPLGIAANTSFFPTPRMKENLAYVHKRNDNGTVKISEHGHPFKRPLVVSTQAEVQATINSGGAGLFSRPTDFCQIIAMLLNLGKDPTTSNQILKVETVKEMFKNQIPQFPNFSRSQEPSCKPSLMKKDSGEMYPQVGDPPQGWGLSFFSLIQPDHAGRAAGTAWWSGIANIVWWADLETGVGGMLATQILPYGDSHVFHCQANLERAVYAELLREQKG